MKKIISILSNYDFQKAILGALITGTGIYIYANAMYHAGAKDGGNTIMKLAEQMAPGFTDQLINFYDTNRHK